MPIGGFILLDQKYEQTNWPYVPVPTYRAFSCSVEIDAPPALLAIVLWINKCDLVCFVVVSGVCCSMEVKPIAGMERL